MPNELFRKLESCALTLLAMPNELFRKLESCALSLLAMPNELFRKLESRAPSKSLYTCGGFALMFFGVVRQLRQDKLLS
jgi:hypothetical protein